MSQNPDMARLMLTAAVLVFGSAWTGAGAEDRSKYELSDNPAFCAGFLAQHSDRHASMMRTHEKAIKSAFARIGPRDSTDSRGFMEWLHVGTEAAAGSDDQHYEQTFLRCRDLIEHILE